jgi:hypothetical protein
MAELAEDSCKVVFPCRARNLLDENDRWDVRRPVRVSSRGQGLFGDGVRVVRVTMVEHPISTALLLCNSICQWN